MPVLDPLFRAQTNSCCDSLKKENKIDNRLIIYYCFIFFPCTKISTRYPVVLALPQVYANSLKNAEYTVDSSLLFVGEEDRQVG